MQTLIKKHWAKVVKRLADLPKQLAIMKALPIEQKDDYFLTHF